MRACCAGSLARLAMVEVVLAALGLAGIAHVCAELAELRGELTVARHECRRREAHGGAVAVEADAVRHHRHVLFDEAPRRARLTRLRALETSLDAILNLL